MLRRASSCPPSTVRRSGSGSRSLTPEGAPIVTLPAASAPITRPVAGGLDEAIEAAGRAYAAARGNARSPLGEAPTEVAAMLEADGERDNAMELARKMAPDPRRAAVARMLAQGACRRDGYAVGSGRTWTQPQPFPSYLLDKGRNERAVVRAMDAAGHRDLLAASQQQISLRLGSVATEPLARVVPGRLTADGRAGPAETVLEKRDTRAAEQTVAAGRRALAALGAWPWTHFAHGRLERTWRDDREVLEALTLWYDEHREAAVRGHARRIRAQDARARAFVSHSR